MFCPIFFRCRVEVSMWASYSCLVILLSWHHTQVLGTEPLGWAKHPLFFSFTQNALASVAFVPHPHRKTRRCILTKWMLDTLIGVLALLPRTSSLSLSLWVTSSGLGLLYFHNQPVPLNHVHSLLSLKFKFFLKTYLLSNWFDRLKCLNVPYQPLRSYIWWEIT